MYLSERLLSIRLYGNSPTYSSPRSPSSQASIAARALAMLASKLDCCALEDEGVAAVEVRALPSVPSERGSCAPARESIEGASRVVAPEAVQVKLVPYVVRLATPPTTECTHQR